MSIVEPATALAPERRPAPGDGRRAGEHLRPVRRPGRRRSPAVPVLVGAGIVIAALFALAVMHALLIGGQIRLDDTQRAVASETEEIHRLRLEVAELESPDRVLRVARTRLGMVQPTEVGYLAPIGVDTADAELVRVAPAERPAPPRVDDTADDPTADTTDDPDGDPMAEAAAGDEPTDGSVVDDEVRSSVDGAGTTEPGDGDTTESSAEGGDE